MWIYRTKNNENTIYICSICIYVEDIIKTITLVSGYLRNSASYELWKGNYRFRRSCLRGRPSAYAVRVHQCNRRIAVTGADAEEAIVSSTARGACAPIMISFVISFPSLVLYVPRTSVRMQLFIYFVVHTHSPANVSNSFSHLQYLCHNTYRHNPDLPSEILLLFNFNTFLHNIAYTII